MMLALTRATKYRVYPTKEQEAVLQEYIYTLKKVYNAVLEQRFRYDVGPMNVREIPATELPGRLRAFAAGYGIDLTDIKPAKATKRKNASKKKAAEEKAKREKREQNKIKLYESRVRKLTKNSNRITATVDIVENVMNRAIAWHNKNRAEHQRVCAKCSSIKRVLVNYLAHCHSQIDLTVEKEAFKELRFVRGGWAVDRWEICKILRAGEKAAVLQAIRKQYPDLAEECDYQQKNEFGWMIPKGGYCSGPHPETDFNENLVSKQELGPFSDPKQTPTRRTKTIEERAALKVMFQYDSPVMSRQLTELRQENPFVQEVPRSALVLAVQSANMAFKHWHSETAFKQRVKFFEDKKKEKDGQLPKKPKKKNSRDGRFIGCPRFKKRRDTVRVGQFSPTGYEIGPNWIKVFPERLGLLKAVIHREPPANRTPRQCNIKLEGGKWYCSVAYAYRIPEPCAHPGGTVGIDLGVEYIIADSDGHLIPKPKKLAELEEKIRKLKSVCSRKNRCAEKNGHKYSKSQEKRNRLIAKLISKKSRIVSHLLHQASAYYAKRYSIIRIEDLSVANMTASARGNKDNPGKNVKQKAGLNRSILESSWFKFRTMLMYKAEEFGGQVILVPPEYTSQRCSTCGHISAENRPTRNEFLCVACGHSEHADINAAKNIRDIDLEKAKEEEDKRKNR